MTSSVRQKLDLSVSAEISTSKKDIFIDLFQMGVNVTNVKLFSVQLETILAKVIIISNEIPYPFQSHFSTNKVTKCRIFAYFGWLEMAETFGR